MSQIEFFLEHFNIYKDLAEVKVHSFLEHKEKKIPLVSVHFGNPKAPTLFICGGIHGLERIGAQLALSLLNSFHQRLSWDLVAQDFLKLVQIVFVPLANPIGYLEVTRSNSEGIDLMRNASVEAEDQVPFLLGGHRYSNKIPWYRGDKVAQETQFIIDTVKNILEHSNQLVSLDLHSGFGFKDQIWFPYAKSKKTFLQLSELYLFFELFEKSHPYHIYKIEPQSKNYLTHGDIWDDCFLNLKKDHQVYLPLTLEMGSWIWVKKNPLQIFSKTGLFNPIKEHRLNRTLRRHRPLFDFLIHSLISNKIWTEVDPNLKKHIFEKAQQKYYDN